MTRVNLNQELIDKELDDNSGQIFKFKPLKLSRKTIDRLFNHWYVHEMCENYYDTEPDVEDEEYNMYLDYEAWGYQRTARAVWNMVLNLEEIKEQKEQFHYCKEPHSLDEMKTAHEKVLKAYRDYEEKRIQYCNWQEPFMEGNWGMSQKHVDEIGRETLLKIRKFPYSLKNRIYYAKNDKQLRIYVYTRDVWKLDYWFIFCKKGLKLL